MLLMKRKTRSIFNNIMLFGFIASMSLPHTQAKGSIDTHNISNIKDNFKVEVDGNNVILEGKTTDDITSFNIVMVIYKDEKPESARVFDVTVVDGVYYESISLPSTNGAADDGTYFFDIDLTDLEWNAKVDVKDGVINVRITSRRVFIRFIETKYFMTVGETFRFKVETSDPGIEVTWRIPEEDIAITDSEGNVTALANGDARVYAIMDGMETSYPIYVSDYIPKTGTTTYADFLLIGAVLMIVGAVYVKNRILERE